MAFPTGSGSERIKYTKITDLTNTNQALITGVALHIYTVLSVICCEAAGDTDSLFMMIADSNGSSNPCNIFYNQTLTANQSFVWNDKFSFDGDKKLMIGALAAANMDIVCTYIDQDWT